MHNGQNEEVEIGDATELLENRFWKKIPPVVLGRSDSVVAKLPRVKISVSWPNMPSGKGHKTFWGLLAHSITSDRHIYITAQTHEHRLLER